MIVLVGFQKAPYKTRGTLEDSYTAARTIDTNEVERIKPITDRMVFLIQHILHRVTH